MQKRSNKVGTLIAIVVVIGVVLVVRWQQQAIVDWWLLRNYTAPSNVAALAVDDTMTPRATHDFYVNHPDLENQASFNLNCPAGSSSEQTIVLGCYHGDQRGIFLYNITDARLNGVEQVTAAHEMLHAAYDRLSNSQRNYVNGLLEDYYKNDLHDQRLLNTIAAYKKSEPNDVVNEMHSVFGTEVTQLPPALETYYRQYFIDRQKVAGYAAAYQAEFVSRQTQVTQDDAQLKQWQSQITADEADLQNREQELQNSQAELDNDRRQANIAAYNAGVPGYNAQVNTYNAELATTKQLITQYNQLVAARNAIALEEQQLVQAIDSRLQPATQQ